MSVTAAFTASVVAHLNAAGLFAFVDRQVGPAAICVELVTDELLAFVDLEDLSFAVTVARAGTQRLVPDGPLRDHDRCANAGCVSGALLERVLAQRCIEYAR
ncbi:hypothetical protein [Cellulomonas fimi]|uniref:hypothetical protein n=1 Tax=Cellulomonas fimi TaxID=1708 RepID=UPI00235A1CC0|nr:hypothetical protein [Cellulomonas fimi]